MTRVLITVDTELSPLLHQQGVSARRNFDSSIRGLCAAGEFGVGWQMDRMEAHGLKGVFFVEPLCGLVAGETVVADIVGPILARGHEVQLHIHTEWLNWVKPALAGGRQGHDLADFSLEDQIVLLGLASDLLVRAGAPKPTAFRAGNFGANDDSLRALATLGIAWDSSVNAPFLNSACQIGLGPDQTAAVHRLGVIELPVSGLFDRPGNIRHAQVNALSAREMRAALAHAALNRHDAFVIVTHSFEMLSRDRTRPNRAVMRRFENMCRMIETHPGLVSAGFHDLDPAIAGADRAPQTRLGPGRLRTGLRMLEQALATWRYERQLLPV